MQRPYTGNDTHKTSAHAHGSAATTESTCSLLSLSVASRPRTSDLTTQAIFCRRLARPLRPMRRLCTSPKLPTICSCCRILSSTSKTLFNSRCQSRSTLAGSMGVRLMASREIARHARCSDAVVFAGTIALIALRRVPADPTFSLHWLAVDGVQPLVPQNPDPNDVAAGTPATAAANSGAAIISRITLGGSEKEVVVRLTARHHSRVLESVHIVRCCSLASHTGVNCVCGPLCARTEPGCRQARPVEGAAAVLRICDVGHARQRRHAQDGCVQESQRG